MVLQSKRIGRFFMIGVYDYTVIATYLSLLLGLGGLYSAAQNEPLDAMLCLMLAGLLDAFDGRIARTKKDRTEQEKRFGIQIDSLNDLVCFGVLPAAIGWSMDCDRLWFLATMSFFALCALIRLAYFNVTEEGAAGPHKRKPRLLPRRAGHGECRARAAFLPALAALCPELRGRLRAGAVPAWRTVHHTDSRQKAAAARRGVSVRVRAWRICCFAPRIDALALPSLSSGPSERFSFGRPLSFYFPD